LNVIQQPLSSLKNVPQKLHAKLDADTLLNFASHCGQNEM
jgi:hypothetical protein